MAPFCLRPPFHHNKKCLKLRLKNERKMRNMQDKFKRLKAEMKEIGEDQKNIREGQEQVRAKFETIVSECEVLKKETRIIIHKTARTQIKLALMFRILKASQQGDTAIAANLTGILREMVRIENEERQAQGDN